MRPLQATIAACGVALAAGAPAGAIGAPVPLRSTPWATVNVCDTAAHPNAVGVRASVPGLKGVRTHLYLRVQLEFRGADGTWADLGNSGDSGWIDAGKSTTRSRQAGRTFTISPPTKGQDPYVMRGRALVEWRRGRRVLRRLRIVTTSGHRHVAGGDPGGFSAASCSVT